MSTVEPQLTFLSGLVNAYIKTLDEAIRPCVVRTAQQAFTDIHNATTPAQTGLDAARKDFDDIRAYERDLPERDVSEA